MECILRTRNSKKNILIAESKSTEYLYNNVFGRLFLKVLYLPFISKIGGIYMNSSLSKLKIKKFIYQNNINMNDYQDEKYQCFNDFFTRKIKTGSRKIIKKENVLISPCDAKLSVYQINKNNTFKIKNSHYKLNDLVKEDISGYENGYALVFRLCVDDYHRYCFIDDGSFDSNIHLKGVLHTVRPIALEKHPVFALNDREYSILHTKHFDDVISVEVGAMMVGKIVNLQSSGKYQKGEEKGYFKFGGSTIILLLKDIVNIDQDIIENSQDNIETIVKYGEQIGLHK